MYKYNENGQRVEGFQVRPQKQVRFNNQKVAEHFNHSPKSYPMWLKVLLAVLVVVILGGLLGAYMHGKSKKNAGFGMKGKEEFYGFTFYDK
jgi:hypothetical protein